MNIVRNDEDLMPKIQRGIFFQETDMFKRDRSHICTNKRHSLLICENNHLWNKIQIIL